MNRWPGGRLVRAVVPVSLCAALVSAPLWGVQPVRAVTPEQAIDAGYVPNPAPALARITIDDITPRVLDGAGAGGQVAVGTEAGVPTVTVSGTIINVGDVPLESVDVRLQRGPGSPDAESVREPLVWSEPSFPVQGEFLRVAVSLAPGESVPYRVSMPAREIPGDPGPDLQLTEPGVYPLLVNVNGTPEGGSPARLDDARTLIPVLRAPPPAPIPGVDDDEVGAAAPADAPDPAPVPLTVLWPLAAAPTRIALVPGEAGPEPVVALTDGSLPHDLADEGRLTGLVRAASAAFEGPAGEELRRATCLGVDPDLLGTVAEIADGRAVVIDEGSGPHVPGERDGGSDEADPAVDEALREDASRWLTELRALSEGACVVSLPAAQADLDVVAAVGDTALTAAALDRSDSVQRILEVAPVPGVLVPASGALAPGTARALAGGGVTAVVAAPSTRTDTGVVPPPGMVAVAGTDGGRALTYSAAVGASLAATGGRPENPRYSDPSTRYWLDADTPPARLQDAKAAILAPVIDAAGATAPDATATAVEQGVLAVPPQVWDIDADSAGSLLETLGDQLSSGRMRAVSLPDRLAGPVTIPEGSLAEDPTGAPDPGLADPFAEDPAGDTVGRLTGALAGAGTLRSLVDTSDPTAVEAAAHLSPLVGDALRAISETGRRAGGDGLTLETGTGAVARDRGAARLVRLGETVSASLARVDLLTPGSVFTMASPNSPLMLVTRNALPFPVRVDVTVTAPEDITVDPVGLIQIPAAGSRTLQVPTQSDSEGGVRRTVVFSLHGPDGTRLSDPVELSVQSGGYPVAQGFAIAAAALALVLGGRRYLRYRRGILDPADEGHRP
ncbi:hypothetical protein H483_0100270 [Dietzia sp. UCD-THP]|uniref:hypothetical protein n=1 Tax=Dietzia sp. UCD-THP TaxID=1292020 RepID=UPI00035ED39F|nr:hypothetical protein [Dietzia sp. UCD-THP]EYT65634.1 hypothetical protein H483_0100270 [Dietzia sp. UCD-THP]